MAAFITKKKTEKKRKGKSLLIFSLLSLLKHNFQKKHFELSGRMEVTLSCEKKQQCIVQSKYEKSLCSQKESECLYAKKVQCFSVNQNSEY